LEGIICLRKLSTTGKQKGKKRAKGAATSVKAPKNTAAKEAHGKGVKNK